MPDLDTPAGQLWERTTLEAHNWHTITCQCDHHTHTRKGGCTNRATHHIEFHALDHCNQTADGETPNPFGNYVFILCYPCLQQLAKTAARHAKRLNRYGRATCQTCGAPIAGPGDIIREVSNL